MNESTLSVEKHLTICKSDHTILDCLSENCPQISKQKLKLAMKYGAVWLTAKRNETKSKTVRIRRAKKVLSVGDEVHLYYDEKILFNKITSANLIADEGDYSVWDKPCGMFSQGSKWGDHTSIARWVELFGLAENGLSQRPCFSVHRLDRATNGLILVAHSKSSATRLAKLFETRKIQKRYVALVKGEYQQTSKPTVIDCEIDGRSAVSIILSTDYHSDVDQTLLMIEIKTGRKHQIRRHLAAIGFPVVGDRLYSGEQSSLEMPPDLQLKACFIEFVCPIQQIRKSYILDMN